MAYADSRAYLDNSAVHDEFQLDSGITASFHFVVARSNDIDAIIRWAYFFDTAQRAVRVNQIILAGTYLVYIFCGNVLGHISSWVVEYGWEILIILTHNISESKQACARAVGMVEE